MRNKNLLITTPPAITKINRIKRMSSSIHTSPHVVEVLEYRRGTNRLPSEAYCCSLLQVRLTGFEPVRPLWPLGSQPSVSTNSTISA